MHQTPEQIRTAGLAALKRELGVAGMIRFLQQFDPGSGDWAMERRTWAERMTLDQIVRAAKDLPRRQRSTRRKRPAKGNRG